MPNDVFHFQDQRYTVVRTELGGIQIRIHRREAEDSLILDQDTLVGLELK